MHPDDGDGYDDYRVADGYVSGGGTRDGGGNRQSFFGPGCKPYNGWVFFPVSFLSKLQPGASGRASFPFTATITSRTASHIRGDAGPTPASIPARSPLGRSSRACLRRGQRRGREAHRHDRFDPRIPNARRPHPRISLERFYFTDLYGMTRWEAWKLRPTSATPAKNVPGPDRNGVSGHGLQAGTVPGLERSRCLRPPKAALAMALS